MHILLANTIYYKCASWRVDNTTKYYSSRQINHNNGYILSPGTERQKYSCQLIQSLTQNVSIAQAMNDIINLIYMQKLLPIDQYWWTFCLAKFDASTTSFEAKLCQALVSSILGHLLHIMQIYKASDLIYNCANRKVNMMMLSY